MEENKNIPKHIGVILDGTRRWAKERGLPTTAGHIEGSKKIQVLLRTGKELGIKNITVYAFSTENFKRSDEEKTVLFKLFARMLKKYKTKAVENNVRVRIFGDISKFNEEIKDAAKKIQEETKHCDGYNFNVCLNYGGREELVKATKEIVDDILNGKISKDDIDENIISNKLYSKDIPDPDLIIRTSGEQRLSNFLTYQAVYSELYFTKVYWPDFGRENFIEAVEEFKRRNRRFGGN